MPWMRNHCWSVGATTATTHRGCSTFHRWVRCTNPSLVTLLSLEPPSVIAVLFTEQILSSVRNRIDVLTPKHNRKFQGTYTLIREIANRVGRQAEGELMILNMQNAVRTIMQKAELLPKPTVYIVLDFGSFDSSATKDTFLSEMVGLAGGINIADDAQNWTYSKELLMAHDPRSFCYPQDGGNRRTDAQGIYHYQAVCRPQRCIRLFDADLISRQGPAVPRPCRTLCSSSSGAGAMKRMLVPRPGRHSLGSHAPPLTLGPSNIKLSAPVAILLGKGASANKAYIILQLRLPRILSSFLTGAILGLGGAVSGGAGAIPWPIPSF